MDVDQVLAHHGVKGMRWGVRNKKRKSTDRTHFAKSPSRLTNDELKSRITRLEQEKRYNDLNRRDISVGEKHVVDLITQIGKGTIASLGGAALLYAGKQFIKKNIPDGTFKEMFPKKK